MVVKLPVFVWQGEVVKAFYSRIFISGDALVRWHFSLPKKERKKKKRKDVLVDATGGHGEGGVPTVQIWRWTVK